MSPFEIAITVFLAIVALTLILALYRFWSVTLEVERLVFMLSERLSPLLQELEETSRHLEEISSRLENRIGEADEQLQDIAESLQEYQSQAQKSLESWKQKLSPKNLSASGIFNLAFKGYNLFKNLRNKTKSSSKEDTNYE